MNSLIDFMLTNNEQLYKGLENFHILSFFCFSCIMSHHLVNELINLLALYIAKHCIS